MSTASLTDTRCHQANDMTTAYHFIKKMPASVLILVQPMQIRLLPVVMQLFTYRPAQVD